MNGTEANKTPWQIQFNAKIILITIKKSADLSFKPSALFYLTKTKLIQAFARRRH